MSVFQGNVLRNEPALISGLVQAVLGVLLAFGVDLSNEQVGSIMAATAIILSILVRMLVTPTPMRDEPPVTVPPPEPPPSVTPTQAQPPAAPPTTPPTTPPPTPPNEPPTIHSRTWTPPPEDRR